MRAPSRCVLMFVSRLKSSARPSLVSETGTFAPVAPVHSPGAPAPSSDAPRPRACSGTAEIVSLKVVPPGAAPAAELKDQRFTSTACAAAKKRRRKKRAGICGVFGRPGKLLQPEARFFKKMALPKPARDRSAKKSAMPVTADHSDDADYAEEERRGLPPRNLAPAPGKMGTADFADLSGLLNLKIRVNPRNPRPMFSLLPVAAVTRCVIRVSITVSRIRAAPWAFF